jgi:hypothetical protein
MKHMPRMIAGTKILRLDAWARGDDVYVAIARAAEGAQA